MEFEGLSAPNRTAIDALGLKGGTDHRAALACTQMYLQAKEAPPTRKLGDLDLRIEALQRIACQGFRMVPAGAGFGRAAPGSQLDLTAGSAEGAGLIQRRPQRQLFYRHKARRREIHRSKRRQ